jgi:hypothetical protein
MVKGIIMKNIFNNRSIYVLLGLACILIGCRRTAASAKPDPAAAGGTVGSITFTGGIPEGEFVVYITPETGIDWLYLSGALYASAAIGSSADINGDSVTLYPSGQMEDHFAGTPFDKNGSYTVILGTRLPLLGFKYAAGIAFKNGKAAVPLKEMIDL